MTATILQRHCVRWEHLRQRQRGRPLRVLVGRRPLPQPMRHYCFLAHQQRCRRRLRATLRHISGLRKVNHAVKYAIHAVIVTEIYDVGYIFAKQYTQTAGCTGYYQVLAYSVGVCQIDTTTMSTSFKYSTVETPDDDTYAGIYFTAILYTYSDTACTSLSDAVTTTYYQICQNNPLTGIPQLYAHSTYAPDYPVGFVLA
jgi:hypothetical protein